MLSNIARRSRCIALFAALTLLLLPSRVFAQSDAKVAAESLFESGLAQLEAGKFAEACKSFAESQRLDPSVGTALNLGRCNEKQGKLASAWGAYKEAAQLARARKDADRERVAEDLASALKPKLSMLTITAKDPVSGLVIRRNGLEVGALGVPIAVDPGEHTVEGQAPGYKTATVKVTVGPDADKKSVEVPVLEKSPDGPGGGPGEVEPGPVPGPSGPGEQADGGDGGMGLKVAGFVVGGVGVVGLVMGTAFGVVASNTASNAEEDPALCPDRVCSPAGREEIDSAETQATISTVGFAVGGAALAGGVILVIVGFTSDGGSASGEAKAATVRPMLSTCDALGAGAVVGVEGGF
jgi:hypothetical protein